MKMPFYHWFKNTSIANKLYFVVGIMAFLIAAELFTLWFAITTLSSVRAYVGGEGLWSKAQKDAIYSLRKYGQSGNEEDYKTFEKFMQVSLGDRKARLELSKKNPDWEVARNGFLQGRNHPDDIDGMITLFRRFHNIYYINLAIVIWTKADVEITRLMPIAEKLHAEINKPLPSRQVIENLLKEIDPINLQLTVLEDGFSYTLGEGSRWLEGLILKILLIVALTVEASGLLLTILVSKGITKGLQEIIHTSRRVAEGNFNKTANVFSKDEIGQLALSFNTMIAELQKEITERNQMQYKLKESNKALEQFAYAASHDMKEPLRTVNSYVQLLQVRYKDKLDKEANEFIGFAVNGVKRMENLINGLLTFSRVTAREEEPEWVDCSVILETVKENLRDKILEKNAKITSDRLPKINNSTLQMTQVFQNLIHNSLLFHGDAPPQIHISSKKENDMWLFSVKDNGIGIDKKYSEKIFSIFQRLHPMHAYEGTGIGLAICKTIVERQGGRIWFESRPGEGAVFYFTVKENKNLTQNKATVT